jgi:hypothetical protein
MKKATNMLKSDYQIYQIFKELLENNSVALYIVYKNGLLLQHFPQSIQNNLKVSKFVVKQNGLALQFAPDKQRNNLQMNLINIK